MSADAAAEADVVLLEVSCDSVPIQAAWVKATLGGDAEIDSPLVLSDFWPHGAVCSDYGVFNDERGMPTRSLFVIDLDGAITHAEVITQRGVLPNIGAAIDRAAQLG